MKVPLLDLREQLAQIREELLDAVCEVVESTRYIGGSKVEECEGEIARYVGTRFGIGVSSGTDALLVSLMALDVKGGDIVITTDYSFFATAGVIARLGATPVFIDIEPDTYNINPEALREWLSENKGKLKKVKAIIPVHLYGQCADMDAILNLAQEYDIPVIEDAAQAIGAKYPAKSGIKKAGSMGLLGCFSFFPSKNLGAIGDGGMVVTNSEEFAAKIRLLRNHGEGEKYIHIVVGGNFRLDAIQAAALLVKLPHLERWHRMRRKNAAFYDENIDVEGARKPLAKYGRDFHIYNQYVLFVPERRDELLAFLQNAGIGCRVYYPVPFHLQRCFSELGYRRGDFPVSESAAEHTIALPIYPEMTKEMLGYVAEKVNEFYK